ncbi:MAG: Type II secretion system protein E [uncultured Sulfurovum sp.]|uniref:Type II secretion system protein E n=1 Tax=uncultured Sulfurovum sp. TaxID=269237 RepID=A0A6S6STM2_9BACT|nr:MAG: Type II secretion system protein E [uncultured Sulfurovum sp.]
MIDYLKKRVKSDSETQESMKVPLSKPAHMNIPFISDKIQKRIEEKIGTEEFNATSKQKNTIKKVHLFDILVERENYTYIELGEVVFDILKEEEKCYFLSERSSSKIHYDIHKKEVYYILEDEIYKDGFLVKERVMERVIPHFFPMQKSNHPYLILPKDEYITLKLYLEDTKEKGQELFSEGQKSLRFSFYNLVESAMHKGASDIHIKYSMNFYHVYFRISGALVNQREYLMDKDEGHDFIHACKVTATKDTKGEFSADEHHLPQDARIVFNSLGVDTRIAITPEGTLSGKQVLVARLLIKKQIDKKTFSFSEWGYGDDFIEVLEDVKNISGKLIYATGKVGSGKSTLLSHLLATLDDDISIITIEDPIEYILNKKNATQHEIFMPQDKTRQITYVDYLKKIKRSDFDVLYIAETRKDKGLMESVVEGAKAGGTIYSTIHIPSCFDTHDTLVQVFGADKKAIASLLYLSVNQVLVKKLCPNCKKEDKDHVNKKNLEERASSLDYIYKNPLDDFLKEDFKTYIADNNGCDICRKKSFGNKKEWGYDGRIPVYEYLRIDPSFATWIYKENCDRYDIELKACTEGKGINKLQTFIRLLKEGKIDATLRQIREI